jgi:uncharacterized protein YodC (DUF2158 family)
MEKFADGALVRLKSGGPTMTVEQTEQTAMTGQDGVWCVWFEKVGGRQAVQREVFSPALLEKAEKAPVAGMWVSRG